MVELSNERVDQILHEESKKTEVYQIYETVRKIF